MKNTTVIKTIYVFPSQQVADIAGPLLLQHFSRAYRVLMSLGATFSVGIEEDDPALLISGPSSYLGMDIMRALESTARDFSAGVMAQRENAK